MTWIIAAILLGLVAFGRWWRKAEASAYEAEMARLEAEARAAFERQRALFEARRAAARGLADWQKGKDIQ